jgi:hypothetical protein
MSIGSPGAVNVGSPLYFWTFAITAAATPDPPGDEPPLPDEPDFPELVEHAASRHIATAATAIPERALSILILKVAPMSFRLVSLANAASALATVKQDPKYGSEYPE